MSNISNIIERYLKELLEDGEGQIEIQRNELAVQFRCVPSQINYVLSTRFSIEHGYLVESRRGGGGYVRIVKLALDNKSSFVNHLLQLIGDDISQQGAEGIIGRLREEQLLTQREYELMKAVVSKNVLKIALPARDNLRANVLKAMLIALLK